MLVLELELLTELVLGLVAWFELEVQLAVLLEPELEFEFVSCEEATDWTMRLGMDVLDRGFGLVFAVDEFGIGTGGVDWSSTRLLSTVVSGDTDIFMGAGDFEENVVNWLAD